MPNLTPPLKRLSAVYPLWLPVYRHLCAGRERAGVHSGWALIAWGLSSFLATPDYAGLSRYGSPVLWATIPAFYGAFQLAAAIAVRLKYRRWVDMGAAGIWGFLETFLYTSHARVVMLAVIPTFIVANALSVLLLPATTPAGSRGLVTEEPYALPTGTPPTNASATDAPSTID